MRLLCFAGITMAMALMVTACDNDRTNAQLRDPVQKENVGAEDRLHAEASAEIGNTARLLRMIQLVSEGEVELGKMAAERSASPEVKEYASKLVDEHSQDISAIKKLAENKKLDLPTVESDPFLKAKETEHKEMMQRLSGLSGAAFDAEFLRTQPSGHALLAAIAEQGEKLSKDDDIDGFFKTINGQARDHKAKALSAMPKECGGQGSALGMGSMGGENAGSANAGSANAGSANAAGGQGQNGAVDTHAQTAPDQTGQRGTGQSSAATPDRGTSVGTPGPSTANTAPGTPRSAQPVRGSDRPLGQAYGHSGNEQSAAHSKTPAPQ